MRHVRGVWQRPRSTSGGFGFEDLGASRVRLLNGMLYAAALLGLPVLVSIGLTAYRAGQVNQILLFGGVYVAVLAMSFGRRYLPYLLRAFGLLVLTFGLGVNSLLATALPGSGRIFLILFVLTATMLFGTRGGVIALLLSLATLIGIGWGLTSGQIPFIPEAVGAGDLAAWLTATAVFALLTMLLVASMGILIRGLEASVQNQRRLVSKLQEDQQLLERRVEERTKELKRQALQLETAAEISKLATTTVGLNELMSEALNAISERFDYYHASIFLVDESESWAVLAASTGEAGRKLLARRYRLAVGSASVIGWVTAHREPRVSARVEEDPFHFQNPILTETRSEMAVPLISGERLVGVLDVHSTEPDAFREADVRTMEAIAGDLAIAIENSRLLREREGRSPTAAPQLGERIRSSWDRLSRAGARSVVALPASTELGAQPKEIQAADEALKTGRITLREDGRELAVPVQVRGEVVATIAVRKSGEDGHWTDDDIALITAVAGQAGLALETARQYTEEQRRVAELEVVNRVSQAASQLLRPESLFRIVHGQVSQVLGDTDLFVALYDREADQISYPYVAERGEVLSIPPTKVGQGLTSVVIRSAQPLLIAEDAEARARSLGTSILGQPPQSWLGVPMLSGDAVIGVLAAQDMEAKHRFSEEDAALLTTIAGQVATSLQNLRLLDQIQRSARRERLIHEISSKVRRSADIQTVLETAAREVGRALNASRTSVRLGAGSGGGGSVEPPVEAPPSSDIGLAGQEDGEG